MTTIFCPWEHSSYLFFSSNVPDLVHYSHGIAIFSALIIASLVFINNPKGIVPRLFLLFSILFSFWAILDVILWATNNPSVVMFAWSLQVLLEPVTYAVAFYLFYLYLRNEWPSLKYNLVFFLILLPVIIFLPTDLSLNGLLLETCESIEGQIAKYYSYFANTVSLILILYISIRFIPKLTSRIARTSAVYFAIGLITFLLSFTSGNVISSFSDDWVISQYGLFAMPFFALLIAYSIVKFKAFNIKMLGVQAIVIVLWTLVASLLLVVQSSTSQLVASTTLVFTTISGYALIKSVRKEVRLREEIEQLAVGLERANARLQELDKQKSEFVSIASHQLRSPLTAIRGYAAMLRDGSYGTMPDKANEPLDRIHESAKLMASSIEDFLSVSRIESGNMKYEMADFNLREQAEHIVDDLRTEALKVGLVLSYKSDLTCQGVVHADIGKTQQILHNLINNSLKYTQKGTVTVFVHEHLDNKKLYVEIIDTGIGMSKETIDTLFAKFTRAKNANSVNIKGTGLGLFVAREMARAMQGDITAHSAGDGLGSHFVLELPLVR